MEDLEQINKKETREFEQPNSLQLKIAKLFKKEYPEAYQKTVQVTWRVWIFWRGCQSTIAQELGVDAEAEPRDIDLIRFSISDEDLANDPKVVGV